MSAAATTEVNASQVPIKQRHRDPRDQIEKSLRNSSVYPISGAWRVSSSLGEEGVGFSEDILPGLSIEAEEDILLENERNNFWDDEGS